MPVSTEVLIDRDSSGLAAMLRTLGRSFALALEFRSLAEMSDAQLEARGLSREALPRHFMDALERG